MQQAGVVDLSGLTKLSLTLFVYQMGAEYKLCTLHRASCSCGILYTIFENFSCRTNIGIDSNQWVFTLGPRYYHCLCLLIVIGCCTPFADSCN